MTDEKYVFTQDVREKRITARSARHTRTHCGKGGAVKFPSDYLTPKEIKQMSGEVKSYRLNSPMKWDEFKSMPDDLKITYIKLLRNKYNVPFVYIGNMLGCSQITISREVVRLGLSEGKAPKGRSKKWDRDGWVAWINGVQLPAHSDPVTVAEEPAEQVAASLEDIAEPVPVPEIKMLPVREEKVKAIPHSGTMTLEGRLEDVLNTVSVLLGGGKSKPLYFVGCLAGRRGV